jgi:hypothetical protein
VGRGHFSADLRNFENVVQSRRRLLCALRLYYVLPNFDAFDHQDAGRPGPAYRRSYVALTTLYGAGLPGAAPCRRGGDLLARDFK